MKQFQMMMRRLRWLAYAGALAGASGCGVVAPLPDDPTLHLLEAVTPSRDLTSSTPAVAVANPSLPPYLNRSELVTRTTDGKVIRHENDLWAETLDASIARVLAENLRFLTRSTNIQSAASFIGRDYSDLIEIRIERFDPDESGSLLLRCTWKAQPIKGGLATTRQFETQVPMASVTSDNKPLSRSQTMEVRVKAMNQALAELARVISRSI